MTKYRHGYGKFLFTDGREYIGKWKTGKEWGQGRLTCLDGMVYDGNWENGMRNGKGI